MSSQRFSRPSGVLGGLGSAAGEMSYRTLGRAGEQVSAIGLGGSHVGKPEKLSEQETIQLVRAALDRGLNFLDNSWDYNDGQSELRMGKALRDGYRDKAFLMTKIDGRTREEAARQLDESLQRLQVDHVDLLQHHEIIRYEDADRIFAPGGAMEAFEDAKRAGKLRYIGFTGHKDPRVHLYMLEVADRHGFEFDAVQLPLNLMDAHFRSFEKLVLPELVRRNIGVLGMKSLGGGVILKSNTVSPIECLHYALNLPTSVVITGIDSLHILDQAFEAVRSFRPLDRAAVDALLARTAPHASEGKFELFKTSSVFDSTAQHPEWLGGQLPQVEQLSADS